jgi:hypothetical protein
LILRTENNELIIDQKEKTWGEEARYNRVITDVEKRDLYRVAHASDTTV